MDEGRTTQNEVQRGVMATIGEGNPGRRYCRRRMMGGRLETCLGWESLRISEPAHEN